MSLIRFFPKVKLTCLSLQLKRVITAKSFTVPIVSADLFGLGTEWVRIVFQYFCFHSRVVQYFCFHSRVVVITFITELYVARCCIMLPYRSCWAAPLKLTKPFPTVSCGRGLAPVCWPAQVRWLNNILLLLVRWLAHILLHLVMWLDHILLLLIRWRDHILWGDWTTFCCS
jgi:hypothetical protein